MARQAKTVHAAKVGGIDGLSLAIDHHAAGLGEPDGGLPDRREQRMPFLIVARDFLRDFRIGKAVVRFLLFICMDKPKNMNRLCFFSFFLLSAKPGLFLPYVLIPQRVADRGNAGAAWRGGGGAPAA